MTMTDDRADRFCRLYIPAVLDMLEDLGFRDQVVLPRHLRPLTPETVLAGPAFPYRFVPSTNRDKDAVYGEILGAYEQAPEGSVLVTTGGDDLSSSTEAALFGELSATTAQSRGLRGAVVHGGCRDVPYIRRSGFPLFTCYATPKDVLGRYEVVDVGEPITIGNVQVRPGDYLFGDEDGVVVVPLERVDEILSAAEECAELESEMRARLLRKELPTAVYKDYGRF
jgi:regulator of RNase E activity RraA